MTTRVTPAERRHRGSRIAAALLALLPVVLAAALPAASAAPYPKPQSAVSAAAGIPPIDSRTSLLVVAPHPDDETLCCAGVIRRVLAAGGRASIVWLTSGDGSELDLLIIEKTLRMHPEKMRDLAARRMREARAAAAVLGVPAARRFFLGYPDGGLLSLMTDHFTVP